MLESNASGGDHSRAALPAASTVGDVRPGHRPLAPDAAALLAAIVQSSDDAIVSKTLDGVITSWNLGAEHLFGYRAEEVIGRPITILIPPDRIQEEDHILDQLRRGQQIEQYETVRVTKDGRRIEVSLTVSPVRDPSGRIVGASKIARDITKRKRAEEHLRFVMSELNHRVGNTLATVQATAQHTMRHSRSFEEFKTSFADRLRSLALVHGLLTRRKWQGMPLRELIDAELKPLAGPTHDIRLSGPDLDLPPKVALAVHMVVHELCTNATKYGALSCEGGRVEVGWELASQDGPEQVHLRWVESGGPEVRPPQRRGFGSEVIEETMQYELNGETRLEYRPEGVQCHMRFALPTQPHTQGSTISWPVQNRNR